MANDILNNVWPEWQIVRRLGRGSYGTVYEAVRKDLRVERRAAIKVISIPQNEAEIDSLCSNGVPEDDVKTYLQRVVDEFIDGIQLMESFKGVQNIVNVEDYTVVEKTDAIGWEIYIRMELLTPINTYTRDKSLTEQEVIKLGCDICTALERCASRNIIHRNIKPENIFINSFGDFKLGDFGIARKPEQEAGGLFQKGTYHSMAYMAPEAEKSTRYDATADLYSLGLVLYRLLNGNRLPFLETEQQLLDPNERMAAIRRRMEGEPLPAPCDASPEMANILLFACAHDPGNRFSTATAMKNALMNAANSKYRVYGEAPQETVVNRTAPPSTGPEEAASVGRSPETQKAAIPAATVSGRQKKKKAPMIIAVLLIAALLVVGDVILMWRFYGKHDDSDSKESSALSEASGSEASNSGESSEPGEGSVPQEPFEQELEFVIGADGNYSVTGIGTVTAPNIVIPPTYQGKPVTSIGKQAFANCAGLRSIEIPDSVTSIGERAFLNCNSLTSIEIPDSVTSIDKQAFMQCMGLTSVEIPGSVTSIGKQAFWACRNLKSVNILNGVTSIGEGAFESCSSLTSIEIPGSVTSIGEWAFQGCSSLTSVEIPDSVTSISNDMFSKCSSLVNVVIPAGVTRIGWGAFDGCGKLTNVFYGGSADGWNTISIEGSFNASLKSATRYYYSEKQPTESGHFWHWVEGSPRSW